MGQKFKQSLTGQFSRGVSCAVAVRCWLVLQSSGSIPGLGVQDGASTGLAADVGWLQAWVGLSKEHLHVTPPTWWSQHSWDSQMVSGFSQSGHPQRTRQKLHGLLRPSLGGQRVSNRVWLEQLQDSPEKWGRHIDFISGCTAEEQVEVL